VLAHVWHRQLSATRPGEHSKFLEFFVLVLNHHHHHLYLTLFNTMPVSSVSSFYFPLLTLFLASIPWSFFSSPRCSASSNPRCPHSNRASWLLISCPCSYTRRWRRCCCPTEAAWHDGSNGRHRWIRSCRFNDWSWNF